MLICTITDSQILALLWFQEGIAQDFEFQDKLAKLLYFESSKMDAGALTSLDEYISRIPAEQKDIYYLCAPTRELAMESPYLEAFKRADKEVIFVYSAIDDFVMTNLKTFEGRNLISAEKSNLDLGEESTDEEKKKDESDLGGLSSDSANQLCAWIQLTLKDKLAKVRTKCGFFEKSRYVFDFCFSCISGKNYL